MVAATSPLRLVGVWGSGGAGPPTAGALRRAQGSDKASFHAHGLARPAQDLCKPPACWCFLVPYLPLVFHPSKKPGSFPAQALTYVIIITHW